MDYFHLQQENEEVLKMSNLGLAYLGDSVYEVMVRSWLCLHGKLTNQRLHRAALTYVTAPAQAARCEKILPLLTVTEADVFRRGRNTRPHSIPKSAKREEYQAATALETLFGWLYLQGKTDRLNELFQIMLDEPVGEKEG